MIPNGFQTRTTPAPTVPNVQPAESHRGILLATDASPAAASATSVAALLAQRWNASTHACTVVPPPSTAFDGVGVTVAYSAVLERELQTEVDRQLDGIPWEPSSFTKEIVVGAPASEIVRLSERHGADLIVLGLRPQALLDRVFRDETALSVMRHASIPVLAVTPSLTRLPRRIVAAIDFSRASIAAAHAALTLLDPDGSLTLVYVEPTSEPSAPEAQGFTMAYTQGVTAAFDRLRHELAASSPTRIDAQILHGSVTSALLAFARRSGADLVAVGSQRHTVAQRALVGSVTTALARAAECSMLVIPPGGHSPARSAA